MESTKNIKSFIGTLLATAGVFFMLLGLMVFIALMLGIYLKLGIFIIFIIAPLVVGIIAFAVGNVLHK